MRQLPTDGVTRSTSWTRAHAISGDGSVILGNNGGSAAMAWVDGELINLHEMYDARDVYASSYDGSRVALTTYDDGVLLWDAHDPAAEVENIGGLTWCVDMDLVSFGRNFCELMGAEWVQQNFGPIPVVPFDMNDDGTVIIGRAGDLRMGVLGAMWIEDLGWINLKDFFHKQGVTEAGYFPMDNPISISGSGREMVGGLAGVSFSWHVNMDQAYVCQDGVTVQTGFPNGLREMVADGAEFGRCEFLD
jgi:hypothetical protein